ncbi:MAG TPA: response regulator [Longimicrobiales bacterium]|nr:response regulator [Longimicrobiales bacterium]
MILIAERDLKVRDLQKYFLARAGFPVEFTDDGEATLQHARLSRPSLIITEILIPKIDGLALCRRLREDPLTSSIPVIVFSILAAAARAHDAGAQAFLRKPLIESVFLATVQQLIAAQPVAGMEQQWVSR